MVFWLESRLSFNTLINFQATQKKNAGTDKSIHNVGNPNSQSMHNILWKVTLQEHIKDLKKLQEKGIPEKNSILTLFQMNSPFGWKNITGYPFPKLHFIPNSKYKCIIQKQ